MAAKDYLDGQSETKWKEGVAAKLDQIIANTELILQELIALRLYVDERISVESIRNLQRSILAAQDTLTVALARGRPEDVSPSELSFVTAAAATAQQGLFTLMRPVPLEKGGVLNPYANYPYVVCGFIVVATARRIIRHATPPDQRGKPLEALKQMVVPYLYGAIDAQDPLSFQYQLDRADASLRDDGAFLATFDNNRPHSHAAAVAVAAFDRGDDGGPRRGEYSNLPVVQSVRKQLGLETFSSLPVASEWCLWLDGDRTSGYRIRAFDSEGVSGGLHGEFPFFPRKDICSEGAARSYAEQIASTVESRSSQLRWATRSREPLAENVRAVLAAINEITTGFVDD